MNELPLPFVNDLKHLGNALKNDNSMTIDCNKKRAIFISKLHSLNQEFYFNSPELKTLECDILNPDLSTYLKIKFMRKTSHI